MASLDTNVSTFNLLATPTTVNAFAGASVALNIGHASAAAAFPGGISIPIGKTLSGAGAINISGAISGGDLNIVGQTGNVSWNQYTPTLYNISNIAASTATVMQWMRVGNTVFVAGEVDIDPTAGGAARLDISLPIATTFGSAVQLAGTGAAESVTEVWGLSAVAAGLNRAQMNGIAVDTANHSVRVSFGYQVL